MMEYLKYGIDIVGPIPMVQKIENDQKIQNWWIFYDREQLYAAWS